MGKQYLGSVGKIDRGVVTVTTCWADERLYYPLHAVPYTPAHHFPGGKNDPPFRTKLQIGAALARAAKTAGVVFRAVVADCAYGDHNTFRAELSEVPPANWTAGVYAAGARFCLSRDLVSSGVTYP
ncbi:SRSO17 transposase [Streptomyces umbrinus]|uniref:SRSO17 transposase n=1 Tax=Streptomyces umbrinus TaxID=67370 RepID=A0ABU0TAX2_9ACTN|nr:transposase [Streptomyces umbrinus]MDQ1032959.1 SRSO17 transposase [Streptomyces umbrinus]